MELETPSTSPLAIGSLVAGILSLFASGCCFCGALGLLAAPVPVVAIVLGIIAVVQIGARPEALSGKPLAFTGIGLAVLSFLLGITFFILAILLNVGVQGATMMQGM